MNRITLQKTCSGGVFDDNSGIIFSSSPKILHCGYLLEMPHCLSVAVLMITSREIIKIILELSSNTALNRVLTLPSYSVFLLYQFQPIMDCAFSPDGTALATASLDGEVKFFQVYMNENTSPR